MKVCEKMKKVTIRTSGFALLLFGFIEVLIVAAVFILISDIINGFSLRVAFALICFILFFSFIFNYIVGNKIELTDISLTVKVWRNEMFPRIDNLMAEEKTMKLNDIEFIYLGRLDFLKKIIVDKFKIDPSRITKELNLIRDFERGMSHYKRKNIGFKHIPFMIIYSKDGERIQVSTKPYSKKKFSELLNQITRMNVEIIVEKGII